MLENYRIKLSNGYSINMTYVLEDILEKIKQKENNNHQLKLILEILTCFNILSKDIKNSRFVYLDDIVRKFDTSINLNYKFSYFNESCFDEIFKKIKQNIENLDSDMLKNVKKYYQYGKDEDGYKIINKYGLSAYIVNIYNIFVFITMFIAEPYIYNFFKPNNDDGYTYIRKIENLKELLHYIYNETRFKVASHVFYNSHDIYDYLKEIIRLSEKYNIRLSTKDIYFKEDEEEMLKLEKKVREEKREELWSRICIGFIQPSSYYLFTGEHPNYVIFWILGLFGFILSVYCYDDLSFTINYIFDKKPPTIHDYCFDAYILLPFLYVLCLIFSFFTGLFFNIFFNKSWILVGYAYEIILLCWCYIYYYKKFIKDK